VPPSCRLASSDDSRHGRELIKQVRRELLEKGRPLLEAVVQDVPPRKVLSLHTDISAVTGERVIVFTLDAQAVCTGVKKKKSPPPGIAASPMTG
jgi:uncharacterized protein YbcI